MFDSVDLPKDIVSSLGWLAPRQFLNAMSTRIQNAVMHKKRKILQTFMVRSPVLVLSSTRIYTRILVYTNYVCCNIFHHRYFSFIGHLYPITTTRARWSKPLLICYISIFRETPTANRFSMLTVNKYINGNKSYTSNKMVPVKDAQI